MQNNVKNVIFTWEGWPLMLANYYKKKVGCQDGFKTVIYFSIW